MQQEENEGIIGNNEAKFYVQCFQVTARHE